MLCIEEHTHCIFQVTIYMHSFDFVEKSLGLFYSSYMEIFFGLAYLVSGPPGFDIYEGF